MRAISTVEGFTRSEPSLPSRMTGVPFGRSSAAGSIPDTSGMSSERARIATCEDAPPVVVANPSTRARLTLAVSDGVSSSATRIVFSGYSGDAASTPVSFVSTRRPMSRRSFARAASSSFRSRAS
jgi:hypothetical protein